MVSDQWLLVVSNEEWRRLKTDYSPLPTAHCPLIHTMSPHNHYEAAFEAYLRRSRIPFVAVRERKRNALDDGETLKNLDFIVSNPIGDSWLVDVKGRKFPGGSAGYWKHWTTRDDLVGMAHWQSIFGEHYNGLFVFAYWICGTRSPVPEDSLFSFHKKLYAFVAIPWFEYLSEVRLISPQWNTYGMSTKRFRDLAKPFEDFVSCSQVGHEIVDSG